MIETIGNSTLYLGDCLDILPTLDKVDAVVTDPPYGVMLGEVDNFQARQKNQQPYESFSDSKEYLQRVSVKAIEICIDRFGRVVATVGNRNMFQYPQPDDMGVWWNPAGTSRGKWGPSCVASPIFYWGKDPRFCRYPSSPTKGTTRGRAEEIDHPCPKPIGFAEWLVNRASLDDELVLDPFMGSGTTGVACMNLGRKFIGIELEPKYFEIACERIEQAQKQQRLFA